MPASKADVEALVDLFAETKDASSPDLPIDREIAREVWRHQAREVLAVVLPALGLDHG